MDQPLSPLQSTFAQFLAEEENIDKMDQPLSLLPSSFAHSFEEEVNTSQPVSLLQRTFTQSLEEDFNMSQMDHLQSTFPSSQPLVEEVKTSKKAKPSSRLQRTKTCEEFDSDKVSELSSIVYLSEKDFDFEFEEEEEPPKPLPSKAPANILPWKQSFKFKQNWLGETDPAKIGPANCNLTTDSTPVEFFSLIFDDDMFGDVLSWTNKRAAETIDNTKRRRTKNLTWKNLTLSEMKSFFAALYLMGINRMPSYKMYWSSNTTLFSAEGVRSLFSRQRFHDIYNCVCLRDPSHIEPDKENKFYKIEPFALSLLTNSQFYYRPHQDLSIDESMIRFRGRAGFKVYEPRKPIKHGLKAYVLCDAHTGYVLNWKLYTGKSNETVDDIVKKLIKGLGGDGYRIFMDSYYTSVKLFQDLKELNLGACGTTVGDRLHMTKEIANDVKGVGDHQIQYYTLESDPSILLSCWKDHKLVHVLSNYHSINQVDVERRLRRKDRTELTKIENLNCKETLSIPESIADYNAHMGGVDRFDQYASYYIATLGTSRWYVKVMFHLCEMAMINSYIIYKSTFLAAGLKPLAHLDYRKEVIRGLSRELRQSKFLLTSPEKKRKCEPKFRHSDSLITTSSQDIDTETSLQFLSSLLAESTQATTQTTTQSFQLSESLTMNNQDEYISISQAINNRTVHRYYTRSQPWPKKPKTRKGKRTISELENHPCRLEHIATSELSEGKIRKGCMICKWRTEKQQEMDDIARLKGLIRDDNREPMKKKRVHQTSFWCETCEVPVCIVPCYDDHIELRRLKKLKSNDYNH